MDMYSPPDLPAGGPDSRPDSGPDSGPPAPPRKRGAQPGNRNSLRHGLYSRSFRQVELSDLKHVQAGLESEIAMLRVVQNRLLACAGDFDHQPDQIDLKTAISLLQALGATSMRIASLMKAQARLAADQADQELDLARPLSIALQVITKELGIR